MPVLSLYLLCRLDISFFRVTSSLAETSTRLVAHFESPLRSYFEFEFEQQPHHFPTYLPCLSEPTPLTGATNSYSKGQFEVLSFDFCILNSANLNRAYRPLRIIARRVFSNSIANDELGTFGGTVGFIRPQWGFQ